MPNPPPYRTSICNTSELYFHAKTKDTTHRFIKIPRLICMTCEAEVVRYNAQALFSNKSKQTVRQPDHTSLQSPVTNQAVLLSLDVVALQNITQPCKKGPIITSFKDAELKNINTNFSSQFFYKIRMIFLIIYTSALMHLSK